MPWRAEKDACVVPCGAGARQDDGETKSFSCKGFDPLLYITRDAYIPTWHLTTRTGCCGGYCYSPFEDIFLWKGFSSLSKYTYQGTVAHTRPLVLITELQDPCCHFVCYNKKKIPVAVVSRGARLLYTSVLVVKESYFLFLTRQYQSEARISSSLSAIPSVDVCA